MNPAALSALASGDIDTMVAAMTPGGIERQESEGQRKFCASQTIPKEIRGATRDQLEALGFVFGKDADDLFVECALPAGWSIRPTSHSMHNDLVDNEGRRRAGIFYKAAFYDRIAHMSMCGRYDYTPYRDSSDGDNYYDVVVTDGGFVILKLGTWRKPDYKLNDFLSEEAMQWLSTNFPDWRNPLAYWD